MASGGYIVCPCKFSEIFLAIHLGGNVGIAPYELPGRFPKSRRADEI